MQKKNPNGRYNIEFKKMIVAKFENGSDIKELAKDFDIVDKTIYRWIERYSTTAPSGNAAKNEKAISNDELKQMQKKLKALEQENEVLKKCITIFSRT